MASVSKSGDKSGAASARVPILLNATWYDLVRRLNKTRWAALMRAVEQQQSEVHLAAVAGVARAIAALTPDLMDRDRLRIAIVGAEVIEAMDSGRWYQLLPALLGRDLDVEVDLVGPSLQPHASSLARLLERERPAGLHKVTLDQYLQRSAAPDVFIIPHPGISMGTYAWLDADQIPTALATGQPLLGMGYSQLDAEMDLAVLRTVCRIDTVVVDNPFFILLDNEANNIFWGSTLWRVKTNEKESLLPKQPLFTEIEGINEMLKADQQKSLSTAYVGEYVPIDESVGKFLGVFAGQAMRLSDGCLFDIVEQHGQTRLQQTLTGFPEVALVTFRDPAITVFQRASMAATIRKALEFNSTKSEPLDPMSPEETEIMVELLARQMGIDVASEQGHALRARLTPGGDVSGVTDGIPIFVCTSEKDVAGLEQALAQGADPNLRDGEGWTPLMEAARVNAAACIAPLISAGAQIDAVVPLSGFTSLQIAVTRGHVASAKELIRFGADVDVKMAVSASTARTLIHELDCLAELRPLMG